MRLRWTGLVAGGLVMVLFAPSAAASAESITLSTGILLETGWPLLCGMSAQGDAIEAINPADGKVRWKTSGASVPLLVSRGRLLTLRPAGEKEPIHLVLLDANTGAAMRPARDLALPGMTSTVAEGMRSSFLVEAVEEAGTAVVTFRWASWYVGGIPRPANRQSSQSSVTIDLDSFRRIGGTAPATEVPTPRPVAAATRRPGGYGYEAGPFETNGVPFTLETSRDAAGHVAVRLIREPDGASPRVSVLAEGKPLYLNGIVSLDKRHVAAVNQVEGSSSPVEYRWTVVSADRMEPVADFVAPFSIPRFFVAGQLLITIQPPACTAWSLKTGKQVWSRSFRDLRYHGTYPP